MGVYRASTSSNQRNKGKIMSKELEKRIVELNMCIDLLHKNMWQVLDGEIKFKDAKCLANCVRSVLDVVRSTSTSGN